MEANTERRQATCAERVAGQLEGRLDDLRLGLLADRWEWMDMGERADALRALDRSIFAARFEFEDDRGIFYSEGVSGLYDFGLSFDYVEPGTFTDQREGYWRYQLSWGGPSDEFRFFVSPGGSQPYRTEYWFLDWFDGASITLTGDALETLGEVWEAFEVVWYDYDYDDNEGAS
jgi:hypothetical protein